MIRKERKIANFLTGRGGFTLKTSTYSRSSTLKGNHMGTEFSNANNRDSLLGYVIETGCHVIYNHLLDSLVTPQTDHPLVLRSPGQQDLISLM